jgi:hypothetical protein
VEDDGGVHHLLIVGNRHVLIVGNRHDRRMLTPLACAGGKRQPRARRPPERLVLRDSHLYGDPCYLRRLAQAGPTMIRSFRAAMVIRSLRTVAVGASRIDRFNSRIATARRRRCRSLILPARPPTRGGT